MVSFGVKSLRRGDFCPLTVPFFNEINLHPYSSYYLRNTVKLIRRSSSIIDKYIYPISPCNIK